MCCILDIFILLAQTLVNYSERIKAVKYLYHRCRLNAKDDGDTLLRLIEDAVGAGQNRIDMLPQDALDDWLTCVMDSSRRLEELKKWKKFNRDAKRH